MYRKWLNWLVSARSWQSVFYPNPAELPSLPILWSFAIRFHFTKTCRQASPFAHNITPKSNRRGRLVCEASHARLNAKFPPIRLLPPKAASPKTTPKMPVGSRPPFGHFGVASPFLESRHCSGSVQHISATATLCMTNPYSARTAKRLWMLPSGSAKKPVKCPQGFFVGSAMDRPPFATMWLNRSLTSSVDAHSKFSSKAWPVNCVR